MYLWEKFRKFNKCTGTTIPDSRVAEKKMEVSIIKESFPCFAKKMEIDIKKDG